MKMRWYASILVVILTYLGVVLQQQPNLPNQEIVLQFTSGFSTEKVSLTVNTVKEQLKDLGADHISIISNENGNLKISYYSDTKVSHIKEALSNNSNIELDYGFPFEKPLKNEPSDDNALSYNIDVYEIQKNNGFNGIGGKYAVAIKSDFDRSSTTNSQISATCLEYVENIANVEVALKVSEERILFFDQSSIEMPDTRAGPNV